jgi:hypothetical protein
MQLRTARLCLDCEEVHTDQHCPVCASESFTFLTRWVPISERRQTRRLPSPSPPHEARTASSLRWARRGALGVALVAISQWLWRTSRPVEWVEVGSDEPESDESSRTPTRVVR